MFKVENFYSEDRQREISIGTLRQILQEVIEIKGIHNDHEATNRPEDQFGFLARAELVNGICLWEKNKCKDQDGGKARIVGEAPHHEYGDSWGYCPQQRRFYMSTRGLAVVATILALTCLIFIGFRLTSWAKAQSTTQCGG